MFAKLRIAKIKGSKVILGVDLGNLLKEGRVYELKDILGAVVLNDIGAYSLEPKGCPGECSEWHDIVTSGRHLVTLEEVKNIEEIKCKKKK